MKINKSLINNTAFLNIVLRGAAIGFKFLLILIMAKRLTMADLGEFSLFSVSLMLLSLALGLDFYTYTNREVIISDDKNFITNLQLNFNIVIYILAFPVIYLILYSVSFSYKFIFLFMLLLENLSSEIFRLLTIFNQSVKANIVNLLKNGIWCLAAVLFIFFGETSLYVIYTCWLVGILISLLVGYYFLSSFISFEILKLNKSNFVLIEKGLRISLIFFLGTIILKVLEYGNRYLIEYLFTTSEVGIYSFYSQIASIVLVFTFTASTMIHYPKLIEALNNKDESAFSKIYSIMKKEIVRINIILAVVIFSLIYPLLLFIDKPELFSEILVLAILLVGTFIFSYSLIDHYVLYSYKKDFLILKIYAITLISYVFLLFIGNYIFGLSLTIITVFQVLAYIILFSIRRANVIKFLNELKR